MAPKRGSERPGRKDRGQARGRPERIDEPWRRISHAAHQRLLAARENMEQAEERFDRAVTAHAKEEARIAKIPESRLRDRHGRIRGSIIRRTKKEVERSRHELSDAEARLAKAKWEHWVRTKKGWKLAMTQTNAELRRARREINVLGQKLATETRKRRSGPGNMDQKARDLILRTIDRKLQHAKKTERMARKTLTKLNGINASMDYPFSPKKGS